MKRAATLTGAADTGKSLLPRVIRSMLLFALVICACTAHAGTISVAEHRRQLHDLSTQVKQLESHPDLAGKMQAALPEKVSVATDAGEIAVDYRPLKHDLVELGAADAQKRTPLLAQVRSYIAELNAQAEAFDKTPEDASAARARLAGILARKEFHRVHGPTFMDLVLNRVLQWLSRLLGRYFLRGASAVTPLHVIIYSLIAAAVILVAVWTFRRLRGGEEEPASREIIPFAPSARGWRTWLADARASAAHQDWRNAIHMAYWAGVSFLEEHGAWKPNRARTPREYLRLLSARTPQHPPLAALTKKFEITWYGGRTAEERDFQESLAQLEKLGCR